MMGQSREGPKLALSSSSNPNGFPVDISSFVHGCLRLKGNAKCIDVVALRYEERLIQRELSRALVSVQEDLQKILEGVHAPASRAGCRREGCGSESGVVIEEREAFWEL